MTGLDALDVERPFNEKIERPAEINRTLSPNFRAVSFALPM